MIWYFTPYATDKNYFAAIDNYMKVMPETDWACIRDGDTMFLYSDFGQKLQGFIDRYPNTGLFTCVTNRCHYKCQTSNNTDFELRDIVWHKRIAERVFSEKLYKVMEVDCRIAGHLMMIKKSTWTKLRGEIEATVKAQGKQILGVDTKISKAILRSGLKIRIMEGFYLFHFLRLDKGIDDHSHLV